jgi:large subunit ribosomal protein L35
MPKLKTHSGTKKRFTITKNGKILRRRATGNHLLAKKSASRKRKFAGTETISGKQARTLKRKLGV